MNKHLDYIQSGFMSETIASDRRINLLISEDQIKNKIVEISEKLNYDYAGEELVIVMIMKGAICFVADLIRSLQISFSIEYPQIFLLLDTISVDQSARPL